MWLSLRGYGIDRVFTSSRTAVAVRVKFGSPAQEQRRVVGDSGEGSLLMAIHLKAFVRRPAKHAERVAYTTAVFLFVVQNTARHAVELYGHSLFQRD